MNMPMHIETLPSGSAVEGSLMEFKKGWSLKVNKSIFKIFRSIKPSFTNMLSVSDAQERHQLTYQYLSLLQAKAIEEKDREIILQSLFSRADPIKRGFQPNNARWITKSNSQEPWWLKEIPNELKHQPKRQIKKHKSS